MDEWVTFKEPLLSPLIYYPRGMIATATAILQFKALWQREEKDYARARQISERERVAGKSTETFPESW